MTLFLRSTPIERLFRVVDRYTGHEIARGTHADCLAYAMAFGLCHVEPITRSN